MWISDKWTDYEVLDASDGEKLERFGDYLLIRPDPQVIWKTNKKPIWKKVNAHYHRSSKGGGSWEFFSLPEEWPISYRNLTFRLKPFHFKHTGIFPEQACNWDFADTMIRKRINEGGEVRLLNLFAYTGGATLSAAAAGAKVTHVDASKGMVTWAKENAAVSGLKDAPIRYLVDDCEKFVDRELRRGNTYEAIILDPPSYGRGPGGEVWKMEEMIYRFLTKCCLLMSDEPLFILLNSYTTGLQPAVISCLLQTAMDTALSSRQDTLAPEVLRRFRRGKTESDEICLPISESRLVLPCGACGRWLPG